MRIQVVPKHKTKGASLGFTFTESLVAVFIGSIMLAALYAAFTFGYGTVKLARENQRATQILVEQMETLRLCPFTSIQPLTTNIYYDPTDQSSGGGGTSYAVTFSTNAPALQGLVYYTNKMLLITATATWTNSGLQRTRSIQTYASKNGVQSYVYTPQ